MKGDLSLEEFSKKADEIISSGGTVFAKFTCLNCGSRQTFDSPNVVFMQGICEECGYTSDLTEYGMMVVFGKKTGGLNE